MSRPARAVPARALVVAGVVVFGVLALPLLIGWRLEEPVRSALHARGASVRLVGGLTWPLTGRFARLDVEVSGARLGDVVVDETALSLRGVQVDVLRAVVLRRLVVRHADGGRAVMRVRVEDLRQALEDLPAVRDADVSAQDGTVHVAATVDLLGQPVPVQVRGTLRVLDGRRVVVQVEQMRVGHVQVPPAVAAVLAAPLNPLLTVDRLPVPLVIRRVEAGEETITVVAEPR
ncbi:MAG: LmeA family phospholipid-binding protein [Armatimonadota bacterium]|nr:LmeA family phospholipid-binding protein [Armatimonadota bacterium]